MEEKLVYNIEENYFLKEIILKFKALNNLDWIKNLDELERKLNHEIMKQAKRERKQRIYED